jgi:hypothetical protein
VRKSCLGGVRTMKPKITILLLVLLATASWVVAQQQNPTPCASRGSAVHQNNPAGQGGPSGARTNSFSTNQNPADHCGTRSNTSGQVFSLQPLRFRQVALNSSEMLQAGSAGSGGGGSTGSGSAGQSGTGTQSTPGAHTAPGNLSSFCKRENSQ